jgi:hypothetical protein
MGAFMDIMEGISHVPILGEPVKAVRGIADVAAGNTDPDTLNHDFNPVQQAIDDEEYWRNIILPPPPSSPVPMPPIPGPSPGPWPEPYPDPTSPTEPAPPPSPSPSPSPDPTAPTEPAPPPMQAVTDELFELYAD